jgi:hypothetical protein
MMVFCARSTLVRREAPAPSAERMANSRRRLRVRASTRFARFAHAMSSRQATIAPKMRSCDRVDDA